MSENWQHFSHIFLLVFLCGLLRYTFPFVQLIRYEVTNEKDARTKKTSITPRSSSAKSEMDVRRPASRLLNITIKFLVFNCKILNIAC